jgi:L-fucose isomerase-like protein
LFDLGVEVEENSELDLFESFNAHENDERIPAKVEEMKAELGDGLNYSGVLSKLAQYELTLLDWIESHRGAKKYVAVAGKCWPAFQTQFHFVPCYVNSRLASMGIPVSCEVDIYGALSEYIMTCITKAPATLLDINNSVPRDMYESEKDGKIVQTLRFPKRSIQGYVLNIETGENISKKEILKPEYHTVATVLYCIWSGYDYTAVLSEEEGAIPDDKDEIGIKLYEAASSITQDGYTFHYVDKGRNLLKFNGSGLK